MRQAQEMRARFQRLQDELGDKTVEGSSGGGMVVATANGRQELVSVRIEREVVSPDDVGLLQDLVRAAVNDALARARELAASEMTKIAGGMLPPGLLCPPSIPGRSGGSSSSCPAFPGSGRRRRRAWPCSC